MKHRLKLILSLCLGAVLLGLSVWFSSMEAYDSRFISMNIAIFLHNRFFPGMPLLQLHNLVRQWAHILVFFFVTLAVCFILDCFPHKKILLPLGMAFCFAYARFDEWKKVFFPNRHDDFHDVVRNWEGVIAGILLFLAIKAIAAGVRRLSRRLQKSGH